MHAPQRADAFFPFNNSYARLPDRFFVRLAPTPVPAPQLIRLNHALAISVGFIFAVFSIIAAPAIAFQPASRPIEFLAKYGDTAGLWLLGPALLAGLAIPNIKLQAVLATAMAIELTWFLRQRWAGRL